MWYVIRTAEGKEHKVCDWINENLNKKLYSVCFVPSYENVLRKGGVGHIDRRTMMAGYIIIETDEPEMVYKRLKIAPNCYNLLCKENKYRNRREYIGIDEKDGEFFRSVLKNGIMTVSYIELTKDHRIGETIIGPLEKYRDRITKVDIHHRRALANVPIQGKERRIQFSLWTDMDEKIDWIEEEKRLRKEKRKVM